MYDLSFTGGGDLSFLSCDEDDIEEKTEEKALVRNIAIGDQNGKPVAQTGWCAAFIEKLF